MAVRHALMEVDGVVSADVSYERKKAGIGYHQDLTNPEEMISAIDITGFTASLLE